jgi:predicted esterase
VSSAVPVGSFSIVGCSDGASYALSLGVANGDVFESVLAFSPGFMTSSVRNGTPRCFVSHGVRDAVLPIDMCSRRLVPRLRQAGYDVVYREFDGPHEAPAAIAAEAVHWLGDTQSAAGMPA